MRSHIWIPSLLLACGSVVRAQPAATPRFEVASIKPCKNEGNGQSHVSPGRLRFECVSVDALVREAYVAWADGPLWRRLPGVALPIMHVSYHRLNQPMAGSAGWVQSERFTIDAKADAPVPEESMKGPMLRALLKDRFRLKVHLEPREIPVYALTVAKGGARLEPAKPGGCTVLDPASPPPPRSKGQPVPPPLCEGFARSEKRGGLDSHGVTLAYLCMELSQSMDRDVVDKTGIAGAFDIHLDLTFADLSASHGGTAPVAANSDSGTAGVASDPASTVMDAIRKLGLKLESAKARQDVPVIDHVERPTAN